MVQVYLSQVRSVTYRASVASAGFFRETLPAAGRLSPDPGHTPGGHAGDRNRGLTNRLPGQNWLRKCPWPG